jgi:nucleoside-diphosphate-sugar epimerase
MVRNDLGARTLAAAGIPAVRGDLEDNASLRNAAASVDAVIETASADHAESTTGFLAALAGTGKTYIRTSGTGVYLDLAGGEFRDLVHTEDDGYQPLPPVARRYASDEETIAAAADDVRSVVIRPSMIYGNGGSEQLPAMLRAAMRSGFSGYTAPGLNRYGNVYLDDAARAYVLALEHAQPGSAYNLAADECDFASIAEAIAALLAIPVRAFTDFEEAVSVLGAPLWAHGLACNSRVDSTKARTELGWSPQGPGLIDDLRYGSYRRVWSTRNVTVVTE